MPNNIIEIYNRAENKIALMALCRVMNIGHMDEPNEAAKFNAVLRECLPTNQRKEGMTKEGENDYKVVVPDVFKETIFEAFTKDCYVLAQINMECLQSVVIVDNPKFYEVMDYCRTHGYPKP